MGEKFGEESVFEGLTARQATGMVGTMLRPMHGEQRFKLRHKDAIARFIEETALDESVGLGTRLQCVGHVISFEKLNFEQEKLQVMIELQQNKEKEPESVEGPKVVLILPPNGSEAQK